MQRRHSFSLFTLVALALPAVITSCAAETTPDPGTGGTAGTAGATSTGGMAGTGAAGAGAAGVAGTGVGGTGVAGTGGAAAGTAGTGPAVTGGTAGAAGTAAGTAGTGTAGAAGTAAGAGGSTAGAAGTESSGGTAGTGTAGTSGTGTGAGGYNTDPACMGIGSDDPCPTADLSCTNLRCGLHDVGRRSCVCSETWMCMSCTMTADGVNDPIVTAPATPPAACAMTPEAMGACTTKGELCQPTDMTEICACWDSSGSLEWDCDDYPWE